MKPNVFAVQREIDDWGIWYSIWKNGWGNIWTIWVAICINRHEDNSYKRAYNRSYLGSVR